MKKVVMKRVVMKRVVMKRWTKSNEKSGGEEMDFA